MEEKVTGYIGRAVLRSEDERLLRGFGQFLDDIAEPPGTLHIAFVRSPTAHAEIKSIDTRAAEALAGVAGVVTGADMAALIKPMRADYDQPGFAPTDWPAMATDKVLYVGEIVAAVLADDAYTAETAIDLVEVRYDDLPALTTVEEALAPGAQLVHQGAAGNVYYHDEFKTEGFDKVFEAADHIFSEAFDSTRIAAVSIEPRGCMAEYDRGEDSMVFWASHQMPHMLRDGLAELLDWPHAKIRVKAPDVGGGFGMKAYVYPEDLVVAALARKFRCTTKWICDRREDFLASVHARDHFFDIEIAVTKEGVLQALRAQIRVNSGAYSSFPIGTAVEAGGGALMLLGPYRMDHYAYETKSVATHLCPAGAYRGVSMPSACFATEVLMDRIAHELGLDPAELRRRNLLTQEDFPYVNAVGTRHDSGTFMEQMERALELIDYDEYRRNQPRSRIENGTYRGIGIATMTEYTGQGAAGYRMRGMRRVPGFDGATVKIEPNGKAIAYVSQATQGQGHLTAFAQIVAEQLGLSFDDVTVVQGDTELTPYGMGTGASRGAVAGGGAVLSAAGEVRKKMLRIAAHLLEVSAEDLGLEEGKIFVRGAPKLNVSIDEIATVAHSADERALPEGETYGLHATEYCDPPKPSISGAFHIACIAIEQATGLIKIERYVMVHDCGRIINPLIVEGQMHGSFVQGMGQALMEAIVYEKDGQLLTAHLMDYLLPTTLDVPEMVLDHFETPSRDTVGGFKGVGEGGTVAALPAIANAVADALSSAGANVNRLPLTPAYVLDLIEAGKPGSEPRAPA